MGWIDKLWNSYWWPMTFPKIFHSEVRSHALRALTSVIYDRRSLKVLTIYDPRYRENASTTYDLRSLPFLTIRDLRSMTFQLTIDDLSPFVRFTIYGSRDSIHGLRSTIDDLCIFKEEAKCLENNYCKWPHSAFENDKKWVRLTIFSMFSYF